MDTSSLASAPVATAALSADSSDHWRFVITSHGDDGNHIYPDYFTNVYRSHDPRPARVGPSYIEGRRFLNAQGISVRNEAIGGHLEVFERTDCATLSNSEASQG